jgi:NitT/TauT family transport system permease protein
MSSAPVAPARPSERARAPLTPPLITAGAWERLRVLARRWLPQFLWTIVSVVLFTAIWEVLWYVGWADPRLLPPPHVFLGDLTSQARFFNTAQRWQIGVRPDAGPSPWMAVLITILSSTMRVLAGLGLAAIVSVALGVAIR